MKITRSLLFILLLAIINRIIFYLYGASIYFGIENFSVQGDTLTWVDSILNLIHHHGYSSDLSNENAWFYRPPGYSFFIGIVYLIAGNDLPLTLKIIPWIQIILDVISVYFIYNIAESLFSSIKTAHLAALLYCCYPFVIVWTSVIYAESLSIFLLLGSLFFLFKKSKNLIVSGILAGLAVLTRLQIMFIIPVILLAFFFSDRKLFLKPMLTFFISFSLIYGMWPLRNLLMHNRLVFSQDLNIGKNWSKDYLSFMDYIFSVQTDHKPQFDQIVYDKTVTWPAASYLQEGDSALLEETVSLCRKCGRGFGYFINYRNSKRELVNDSDNCDEQIAANFNKLTAEQKSKNKLNYYIIVPLKNLQKCLFKSAVYGDKSATVKTAASLLFLFRTLLILAGLYGLILLWKQHISRIAVSIISGFFIFWYFYLCFIYRNIEIRYLLPADVLLLLPFAWLVINSITLLQEKRLKKDI
ncbi:MAG: glycosyltransferase family 39 protein [Bacteroidota bacterium]